MTRPGCTSCSSPCPAGGPPIAGNLTIKGITQPIEFDAEVGRIQGGTLRASGKLVIDRTRYNIKFHSGNFFKDLGDTLIYNDFTLQISLTAKANPLT